MVNNMEEKEKKELQEAIFNNSRFESLEETSVRGGRLVFDFLDGVLAVNLKMDMLDFFNASVIYGKVIAKLSFFWFPDTVIDISEIVVLHSAGIGFLLNIRDQLQKNGSQMWVLCQKSSGPHAADILKLNQVFNVVSEFPER